MYGPTIKPDVTLNLTAAYPVDTEPSSLDPAVRIAGIFARMRPANRTRVALSFMVTSLLRRTARSSWVRAWHENPSTFIWQIIETLRQAQSAGK